MLSILILSIGLRTNLQFKGIISWGLAFICLSFATYFTKYIPNDSERKRNSLKEEWAWIYFAETVDKPSTVFFIVYPAVL